MNVIFIISLIFPPFFPLTRCGKFQGQHTGHLLRMDVIISFTKGLCLSTVLVFKLIMITVETNRAIIPDHGKFNRIR